MRMQPGKFVVFEGIDGSGKTTAWNNLQSQIDFELARPLFLHQPSGQGGSYLLDSIYRMTEFADIESGLARQYLHLAAHAEMYKTLIGPAIYGPMDQRKGVIMDRCWWSTYAYGIAGRVTQIITPTAWLDVVLSPTHYDDGKFVHGSILPDVIFYFSHQYEKKESAKRHDQDQIKAVYDQLATAWSRRTVVVPKGEPYEVISFVVKELVEREIFAPSPA